MTNLGYRKIQMRWDVWCKTGQRKVLMRQCVVQNRKENELDVAGSVMQEHAMLVVDNNFIFSWTLYCKCCKLYLTIFITVITLAINRFPQVTWNSKNNGAHKICFEDNAHVVWIGVNITHGWTHLTSNTSMIDTLYRKLMPLKNMLYPFVWILSISIYKLYHVALWFSIMI